MSKQATIETLKKAVEVMTSNHVAKVEIGFEYEADGVRYYTAVSRKGFELHRYTVHLWEIDGERYAKCNCRAGSQEMTCRHIIRAAEADSDANGIPMHLETVAAYKGHICFAKAA